MGKKTRERARVEALQIGQSALFPKSEYVRICRIVVDMNRSARASGSINPHEIRYRIDGTVHAGMVTIFRDL